MFQLYKSCKVEIYNSLFQIYDDSRLLLWLSVMKAIIVTIDLYVN